MKNIFAIWILSISILLPQTAEEIVDKAEDAIKGETSHAIFEMIIHKPDFTRTLKLESWWEGNEKALIVTKAPQKEEGNKTLKIGDEMWQYLKNTETTIKIPPSMMLQSWNGSDFTNDDLVRESNLTEDYNINIVKEEELNGVNNWKLELIPKENAPVVWGKLYYWVRQNDYLPAVIEYYDEKGNKVRYMVYSNIKNFNGHTLPAEWTMYDTSEEDEYTTIKINDIEFDVNIPPRKFSYQELERGN